MVMRSIAKPVGSSAALKKDSSSVDDQSTHLPNSGFFSVRIKGIEIRTYEIYPFFATYDSY